MIIMKLSIDTEKLKRRRMNVRTKIREYIKTGRDPKDLYNIYENILNELKNRGINVSTKKSTDYLHKSQPIKKENRVKKQEHESTKYIYNLKFLYNIDTKNDITVKMGEYFDSIGLKDKNDTDFEETGTKVIYIKNYTYEGLEESFNIIKKSSNIILDILNESNDPDLEVFGKKVG